VLAQIPRSTGKHLISRCAKIGLTESLRRLALALTIFALWVATPVKAFAQEEDEPASSDFFQYEPPTMPQFKLPKLDIIPFWTNDLKTARRAYKAGKYERALKYFRKSSEDGNAVADWYLGNMYRLGHGVPINNAIAYSYYSRAAEGYDPDEPDKNRIRIAVDCQLRLAIYQRDGVPEAGLKADPVAAARTFLRLASNYGHPGAMYAMATMNIEGIGIQKNPQQGLKWLMAAARKRDAEAQAYLGDLYARGDIVKRDETRALMWYLLAMETADEIEHGTIATRYHEMEGAADDETRLEASARARVWAEQYPAKKSND
jgi:uncharacterized protein